MGGIAGLGWNCGIIMGGFHAWWTMLRSGGKDWEKKWPGVTMDNSGKQVVANEQEDEKMIIAISLENEYIKGSLG